MKANLIILFMFLYIGTLTANERIIKRPTFAAWSTQTLEIDKIVLNDTETVLYVDAYFTPNWWIKIVSETFIRANGQEYPVRSANGLSLDEETYMPESGTMSFQLIFPAIPEHTTEIDFIEGYEQGAFCLWDIRLDGTQPTVNRPAASAEKTALPPNPVNYQDAVLKVNLLGYKPDMELNGSLYFPNSLTGNTEELKPEFNSEGTYTLTIPLLHATHIYFNTPYFNGRMYVTPGQESTLTVNLPAKTRMESRYMQNDSPDEIYQFSGALAGLNKELSNTDFNFYLYAQSFEEHIEMMTTISVMDAAQYKSYFMGKYNEKVNELENLNISETLRSLFLQDARMHLAEILLSGKSMITYAYRQANQLDEEAILPEEVASGFTGEYYSFLPELLPAEETALYSRDYPSLVRAFPFYFYISGINDDKQGELPSLSKVLGTDKGLLFDWIKLAKLAEPVNNMIPLTDEQLAEAGNIFPDARLLLKKKSEEVEKVLAENKRASAYDLEKVNIEDIPEEELFAAITYPHRGKVIFVDFWATWCGPCIQAMKVSEPVKDEFMQNNNVVFLYLAGENSPKEKWDEMVPDIKGVHHRVTGKQWDYWWKRFNMGGVPSYMVVGKDGNPVHFQAGFMGVDRMRELLNTELEK